MGWTFVRQNEPKSHTIFFIIFSPIFLVYIYLKMDVQFNSPWVKKAMIGWIFLISWVQCLLAHGPKKLRLVKLFHTEFPQLNFFFFKKGGHKVHSPMGQRSHDWLDIFYIFFSLQWSMVIYLLKWRKWRKKRWKKIDEGTETKKNPKLVVRKVT